MRVYPMRYVNTSGDIPAAALLSFTYNYCGKGMGYFTNRTEYSDSVEYHPSVYSMS